MLVNSILIIIFSSLIFAAGLQSLYEIQLNNEFLASNTYLTFAHRLTTNGIYPGFAQFFFESAEEEREHGKKLLDFYNILNRELLFYDIILDDETTKMDDLIQMINKAAQLEQQVYNSLINLRLIAHNEREYSLVHFIETQMLEEQTLALKYMHDLVERIRHNSNNSTILLQIMDRDLRKKQMKKS